MQDGGFVLLIGVAFNLELSSPPSATIVGSLEGSSLVDSMCVVISVECSLRSTGRATPGGLQSMNCVRTMLWLFMLVGRLPTFGTEPYISVSFAG